MFSKKSLLLFTLVTTAQFGLAQSLPNTQIKYLDIPSSIKIDGKANEWNNQFQAFNHNTNIFYSIANAPKSP